LIYQLEIFFRHIFQKYSMDFNVQSQTALLLADKTSTRITIINLPNKEPDSAI